jgi:hypothetical protein
MKRSILLTCTGLLLAACASGADVGDDDTSADSTVVDVLEGDAPGKNVEGTDTNRQTP